ncbi:MAG: hypothetical protein ABJO36_09885 [Litorimonas sp.]
MSFTRLFLSAAVIVVISSPAFAQTSDPKAAQSDEVSQPAEVKTFAKKDNPILLDNYAQVAAPVDTATESSLGSDKKVKENGRTGHVTLIKSAEGGDTNSGDASEEKSTKRPRHGGDFDISEIRGGTVAPADTGTDFTTIKSNTTGTGNTANGYQALSLQGAPTDTGGDVTGNVTIQKRRVLDNQPSIDISEHCAKFSKAELKSALEACETESSKSTIVCSCTHL